MLMPCIILKWCSGQNSSIKNEQRPITPKVWYFELWFLCTALLLNEIYLPIKFHVDAVHSFKVKLRTKKGTDGRVNHYMPPFGGIKINSNTWNIQTIFWVAAFFVGRSHFLNLFYAWSTAWSYLSKLSTKYLALSSRTVRWWPMSLWLPRMRTGRLAGTFTISFST